MPRFLDRVQLQQAVSSQAVPELAAIAANDNLRSLRRFERDEPPPYVSSTESEDDEAVDRSYQAQPQDGAIPDEILAIMERPLEQSEVDDIASLLESIAYPDEIFHSEAWREQDRLDNQGRGPRPYIFRGSNGVKRQGVIVRHNVKRRWEKLGVWNPEWGFAGRNLQPNDSIRTWKWTWQQHGRPEKETDSAARELIARALHLRRNLRRGEHAPVIPRSRPRRNTIATQAEAFLISRPWFTFQLELAEESARFDRLSVDEQRRYPHSSRRQVIEWWKDRGEWREEFNHASWVTAWKWRHESPSPEPEDLTPLDKMRDSPLDAAADFEFTPSEIDEFETIDLPESEQPKGYWAIERGSLPPSFPGQTVDSAGFARRRLEEESEGIGKANTDIWVALNDPSIEFLKQQLVSTTGSMQLFGPPRQEKALPPKALEPSLDVPGSTSNSPQREATDVKLPRKRKTGVSDIQTQERPLRRSVRIAAMKRSAEPLPSHATPPIKRRRGGVALGLSTDTDAQPTLLRSHATTDESVSTQPLSSQKTKTQPQRARGRPKKEIGTGLRSVAARDESKVAGKLGMPRRRGRPRKH
ncbi:hypothetical protein HD806DRAFT_512031 [Xylariaceae sp. AK1471]|nr:hypothetical protein HD806DRAFT_512031 [Xylariaceae sp. AK1471]